jgi:NADH:ubiquinone oxidoreductase subunit D
MIMKDAELLEKLAEDIKSAAEPVDDDRPSAQSLAIADQMVHRASAALADVHAHAMARVDSMREQLNILESCITDARAKAEENTKRFMQLVTDGEESIRSMEKAVARIGDHLLK